MAIAKSRNILPDFSISPHIDQVGVEERASRFTKRSIKKESKDEWAEAGAEYDRSYDTGRQGYGWKSKTALL